jgi:hypothetical protein
MGRRPRVDRTPEEKWQVLWVKAESIDALRIAYPNFYIDTKAFIEAMKVVLG